MARCWGSVPSVSPIPAHRTPSTAPFLPQPLSGSPRPASASLPPARVGDHSSFLPPKFPFPGPTAAETNPTNPAGPGAKARPGNIKSYPLLLAANMGNPYSRVLSIPRQRQCLQSSDAWGSATPMQEAASSVFLAVPPWSGTPQVQDRARLQVEGGQSTRPVVPDSRGSSGQGSRADSCSLRGGRRVAQPGGRLLGPWGGGAYCAAVLWLPVTRSDLSQLAGGVILGVALWLRHDPQTTNLLYLELGDKPAPNTFYVGLPSWAACGGVGTRDPPGSWAVTGVQALTQCRSPQGIYILIAVGAVMMFVGFLGCYGAIQESQCLLGTFFTCLVILFACEVAAGIWGFVNKDQIAKDVKQFYDQALQQAVVDDDANNAKAVVKTFHETEQEAPWGPLGPLGSAGPRMGT
ncbi:hypothetical protein P7K49_021220 [Saguinus oedipus]|uniref:Tetraspanin n=1 Tax=Saguinus oedipus TaxID=9490 RepID=A0ABQ9US26_SAGOE|nr:hypothetical protein P7K49_021220 [Saguinus oedipus]